MVEQPYQHSRDFSEDLLDLISNLLLKIRADIPRAADVEQSPQEWHDVSELRATAGQIRLLRILITQERCTMQELAEALGVAQPSVTAMVKRLLAQGFVERVHDEKDWRLVWVFPTERGQRAVAFYSQMRRANLQRRLAQLDEEELAHLRAVLPVLRHLIGVEA